MTSHYIWTGTPSGEGNHRNLLGSSLTSVSADTYRKFLEFQLWWLPVMLTASLVQIYDLVRALKFRRGGRNHCFNEVRVFFFTRLYEITPSALSKLVGELSIVAMRPQGVVHGGQVDARLALLHHCLLGVLIFLRIELDLVHTWSHLTLQLLGFLAHGFKVSLGVLLVELALGQFGVDADLLYLIVERVVAEDAEGLTCLRHI